MDDQLETSAVSLSPPKMISGKILWPGGPSVKQYFSLPTSIMYYMAQNPSSPEVYNKMIRSCKYFFEKNPILVAKRIHKGGRKICANDEKVCKKAKEKCCVNLNLSAASKFWITQVAYFFNEQTNFAVLCPKIFRCDFTKLDIHDQHLLYDEFKFLTSTVKNICMGDNKMCYNDGSVVTFGKILESVPNIEKFRYWFDKSCSKKFVLRLNNFPMNLEHLKLITLFDVPEVFNVDDFYALIKNYKITKIVLQFQDNLSDEYRQKLDGLITAVIESEIPNRLIQYPGQDKEKLKILCERLTRYE